MKRRNSRINKDSSESAKRRRGKINQRANDESLLPSHRATASVSECTETFVHELLKRGRCQIRLLRMLPDSTSDEDCLRYSIGTYEFDQVSEFVAISYTWGDPKNEEVIMIDDKICYVRQNCHNVLKLVHKHWKLGRIQTQLLWIDSVCINQEDLEEKSLQVSFMGEIYAKATEVLACTGSHSDDSEFFVEKAWEVVDLRHDCSHSEDFMCPNCRLPWEKWVCSLGLEHLARLCTACETFGRREYWGRIWIIQEVAKARSLRILCGTDILPWTAMRNLEDFLAIEMDEIESVLSTYKRLPTCEANSMHDVFRAKKEPIQIEEVFSQFSDSSCSLPRDRLYGLLGLVDWPHDLEPVVPNYKTSTFEVAVQVVPYFSLQRIPEVLKAFQITGEDETVQKLIRQRQQVTEFGVHKNTSDAARGVDPSFKDYPIWKSIKALCAYVAPDQDGNMTAELTKESTSDQLFERTFSGSEVSSDSRIEQTSDSEESEQRPSEPASLMSSTSPEARPQPILHRSEVIGYVCNQAHEGDILVRLPNLSRCILVIRTDQGDRFNIVGQGMLLPDYDFGCDEGVHDDNAEVALFNAQMELLIAAEDVVLLFAMDVGHPSRSWDLSDCWNHALTCVTTTSSVAARITEQKQMLAKDIVVKRDKSFPEWAKVLQNHSRTVRAEFPAQYSGWVEGLIEDLPEGL